MSQPHLPNVELHLPHCLVWNGEKDPLQVRHLHREKKNKQYPLPSFSLLSSIHPPPSSFSFSPSLPLLFLPPPPPPSPLSSYLFLCHGHGYGLPVHQIAQRKNIMVCYHNWDAPKPESIHETRAPRLVATGTKTELGCLESPENIKITCYHIFHNPPCPLFCSLPAALLCFVEVHSQIALPCLLLYFVFLMLLLLFSKQQQQQHRYRHGNMGAHLM